MFGANAMCMPPPQQPLQNARWAAIAPPIRWNCARYHCFLISFEARAVSEDIVKRQHHGTQRNDPMTTVTQTSITVSVFGISRCFRTGVCHGHTCFVQLGAGSTDLL
jgi:hypothetical protein